MNTDDTFTVARAAVAAAEEAAGRAATRHAQQCCRLAALLATTLLPDAAVLVFDRDEDTVSADTTISLVHIRDAAGELLWYDPDTAFAEHPHARALGTPPTLAFGVLDDIQVQLAAAYDAVAGHFEPTRDGGEQMPWANLLALPVAPAEQAAGVPVEREVVVQAPGRVEHRFALDGDDTVLVLVDGEAALAVDRHGPARWYGQVWQRLDPAGHLVDRSVAIEGIITEAMWRDLEAALGLARFELGRFKQWAADQPKHLSDHYDLDAAVAWARRKGLTYQDERTVRVPADARRRFDDELAGRTVHVLEWDRGEHGIHYYLRASRAGALALRHELIVEHWDKVSGYDEVPNRPPADPATAVKIWHQANHTHSDPDVGVFTVGTAVIAD